MKNSFLVFLCLITFNSFSQEKVLSYHFDYYTIYEYDKSDKDTLNSFKEINYSNSKDTSYILRIRVDKDTNAKFSITDIAHLKVHVFEDKKNVDSYSDLGLFQSALTYDYSLENCIINSKGFYQINYDNQTNGVISIISFKNAKRKKVLNECFLETKPSEITLNQHYNFSPLVAPLWCNKFVLANQEIITNSYYMRNGKKEHIRKLLEISKTDLTIKIDSTNKIQQ
jgi:hypothetical protein